MKSPKSSGQPKKPSDIHPWPFVVRRVSGHSMVPVLPPGTYVLGTRWFRHLNEGSVVIFEHEGKEKIKRISEIMPDGSLYVIGEHPETSTDSRHFGAISADMVVAKVVWPGIKKST